MNDSGQNVFDVIIVGGGLVGTALACALADDAAHPLRVALIEGQPQPESLSLNDYDLRVSAITLASRQLFESIAAWQGMADLRISPMREMHVWDATGNGVIHFDAAEMGEAELGYIIENRVMLHALMLRARQLDNLQLFCPEGLRRFSVDREGVAVKLQSGTRLQGRLLVGADGAASLVRELAGISAAGWAYDQHALVTTVQTSLSHRETAWQRFLPDGPLAFLPLPDPHHCSIVWSTRPHHAEALCAMEEKEFLAALQESFGNHLGTMQACSARAVFPLRLRHATEYVQPCLALIGDAAHTVHPLAGQGVNLGFLDAAALADVILQAVAAKQDPGELRVLRRYERWRRGDNLAMQLSMDGFKRLFGSEATTVQWLRNQGLNLVDNMGPVKELFMRQAMGLGGDVPRLMQRRPL